MQKTRQFLHRKLSDDRWLRALRMLWILMAIVVVTAALSPLDRTVMMTASDKTDHVLAFGALMTVATLVVPLRWRPLLKTAALHFLFGVAIEIGQLWVPGRDGSLDDLVADAAGIAAGAALAALMRRFARP
jgi:VanZ family protein